MQLITKTRAHYVLEPQDKEAIRAQLGELKLTMADISGRLGVSASYFSDVLNGKRYFTAGLETRLAREGIVVKGKKGGNKCK